MSDKAANNAPLKKSITFISRSAPYGRDNSQLCLEMALACAVFEQNVNYVFLDDGVYQLVGAQNASAIDAKTLGNALETLELYGIENICVDEDSLNQRNLMAKDLLGEFKLVNRSLITALIRQSDCVFNL
ncbi:MAG: sulfurtransferase complex subunit TusC [Pseudohongiella sp.]|jgi:tRNA 2-thiouridine synthesizing protein C|nr:sulfurtransferase complex subunit TusC [Pseudohongiella sp.]